MNAPENWQLALQGLRERGQYLLSSHRWSDCKFLVGEAPHQHMFEAHKLYLASSSPVFESMFFGSMPEGNDPIEIPDVQVEAFRGMLRYIYTNVVCLNSFNQVRDLYYCANKYFLSSLAEKCSNYMRSILSPEYVCKIYEFAKFFDETELLIRCHKSMRNKTKRILTESTWEDADRATVSVIFEQDGLAINSEIDLYDALLVWCRAECRRKSLPSDQRSLRSVSGDLLSKIRFLTLTADQFYKGPGKAEILDANEANAILTRISSPRTSMPMPEGFSVERNPRIKIADSIPPFRFRVVPDEI